MRVRIQSLLGDPAIRQFEKYLGLPALEGQAKKQSFIYLKERVWRKLQGWKEKYLSQAGREVLIKSVIQAIPTYTMNCFKLPKGLVKELEVLIRKFWWDYNGGNRKIHWVNWERMCEAKEVGGMGFKEIEKFNDALLAKQVWCMINNLGSLCYRVFKAHFFPDCSILEAKESTIGSYAWKSILSARDVIRKGMVWLIGNGQFARVKKDRWIPKQCNRALISQLPLIQNEIKVTSLINQEPGIWKFDLVEQLFSPHASPRMPPDRIIWGLTPSGCFTTSSVYKLLVSCDSSNTAGSSDLRSQKLFWKGVWNLRVPSKIKHFAWRACNNALPTMVNLHRRHITPTDTCEIYKEQPENQIHALWLCKEVEAVWGNFLWAHHFATLPPSSFSELLATFLQFHEDFRKEIFILCAWCLWNRRNSLRLGLPAQPLASIITMAGRMLQEYLAVQVLIPDTPPQTTQQQWRPPDPPNYKANFDAAVFKATNSIGIGVIIRDHEGEVIGALSLSIPLSQIVDELEALACRRAVQFAWEIGLRRVVFEGDSATVIQAITCRDSDFLPFGNIIDDIRHQVSAFHFSDFCHVNRSCNIVADTLAKRAKLSEGMQAWLECLPADISPLVLFDVP